MLEVVVAAYVGMGFFIISATHSYFCAYFHNNRKDLGFPFILNPRVTIQHSYGYITAFFLGVLSFSLFLNYLNYFFANFPNSVVVTDIRWILGFFLFGGFLIFVASPFIGGGAANKWVLEGSLMLFTLLLILSIPERSTLFGQVQFTFSVSGAILGVIYLFWLEHYIIESEELDVTSMKGALDSFEEQSDDAWAIWGSVVYFVFSGVYILVGYILTFAIVNY